jgi:hypothetical protein
MKNKLLWSMAGICVALMSALLILRHPSRTASKPAANPAPLGKAQAPGHARLVAAYGRLPLSFEVNQGQSRSAVKFMSRASGYTLFLTGNEAVLAMQRSGVRSRESGARGRRLEFRAGCPSRLSSFLFEDRFSGIRRSALISTPAGRRNWNLQSRGEQWTA